MLTSNVGKSLLWQSIYTPVKKQSYSRGTKALLRNTEQPRESSHLLRGRRPRSKSLLWIRSSVIPSSILLSTQIPVLRRWRLAAIGPAASPCLSKDGCSPSARPAAAFAGTAPAAVPGEASDTLGHSCKHWPPARPQLGTMGRGRATLGSGAAGEWDQRPGSREPSDPSAVPVPRTQAVPLRWWPCKGPLLAPCSSSHSGAAAAQVPFLWLTDCWVAVTLALKSKTSFQNFLSEPLQHFWLAGTFTPFLNEATYEIPANSFFYASQK